MYIQFKKQKKKKYFIFLSFSLFFLPRSYLH